MEKAESKEKKAVVAKEKKESTKEEASADFTEVSFDDLGEGKAIGTDEDEAEKKEGD